jgi:hypothetical protein
MSVWLIISLVLTTVVSIIGTLFDPRIEHHKRGSKVRPLGWTFVFFSVALLGLSLYLAHSQFRKEEDSKKRVEERLTSQVNSLVSQIELGRKKVRQLTVSVSVSTPPGQKFDYSKDELAYYLPAIFVTTGDGLEYRFSPKRDQKGELLASVDVWPVEDARKSVGQDIRWRTFSPTLALNPEVLDVDFSFDPDSISLSRGTSVSDFDGARVVITSHLSRAEALRYDAPNRVKRISLIANPGQHQIRLVCLDVTSDSWHIVAPLSNIWELAMEESKIILPPTEQCQAYRKWH